MTIASPTLLPTARPSLKPTSEYESVHFSSYKILVKSCKVLSLSIDRHPYQRSDSSSVQCTDRVTNKYVWNLFLHERSKLSQYKAVCMTTYLCLRLVKQWNLPKNQQFNHPEHQHVSIHPEVFFELKIHLAVTFVFKRKNKASSKGFRTKFHPRVCLFSSLLITKCWVVFSFPPGPFSNML